MQQQQQQQQRPYLHLCREASTKEGILCNNLKACNPHRSGQLAEYVVNSMISSWSCKNIGTPVVVVVVVVVVVSVLLSFFAQRIIIIQTSLANNPFGPCCSAFFSFPAASVRGQAFQIRHTPLTLFLQIGQVSTCLAQSSHATTCPQS